MDFSKEERAELMKKFSFDVSLMHRRLDTGDDFQKVLQGHLFIDHILTAILYEELKKPDSIALDRMTIASKADLAVAMGILDEDLHRPFRKINRLRNVIAHDLNHVISAQDGKEIRDLMPAGLKEMVDDRTIHISNSDLGRSLKVYIVVLDIVRQRRAEYRQHEQRRQQEIAAAIDAAKALVAEFDAQKARSME